MSQQAVTAAHSSLQADSQQPASAAVPVPRKRPRAMTILDVVKYGDPLLTQPTKVVEVFDDSVKQLGIDLLETMRVANGGGMAANQVGDERRVFVMTTEGGEDLVFVNPVIVQEAGMQLSSDGCLSFPGVPLCSVRPTLMVIEAQTVTGEPFTTTFGSELVSLDKMERVSRDAMIASHEIDHLDGKMLVDRLSDEAFEVRNLILRHFLD
jgi:peptide deformylase